MRVAVRVPLPGLAGHQRDLPLRASGPASQSRRAGPNTLSQLNVRGLGSLVADLGVVGDLCAIGERAIAITDDGAVMNEQVLGLVIGRDEPKSLVVAEPLDGSGSDLIESPYQPAR